MEVTEAVIDHMARRFLAWKLPEHFNPDAGISFEPEFNKEWNAKQGNPPQRHQPTGTNLFDYEQAKAMVKHMIEGLPATRALEPRAPSDGVVDQADALFERLGKRDDCIIEAALALELKATLQSQLSSNEARLREALERRSVPTMDPVWSAGFNAALDHIKTIIDGRETRIANVDEHIAALSNEGNG